MEARGSIREIELTNVPLRPEAASSNTRDGENMTPPDSVLAGTSAAWVGDDSVMLPNISGQPASTGACAVDAASVNSNRGSK